MLGRLCKKAVYTIFYCAITLLTLNICFETKTFAKESTIPKGVTIGEIDLSGMTEQEAYAKVNDYIKSFTSPVVELEVDGNNVSVTVEELGFYWKNTGVIKEAVSFCEEGNVIERYKTAKDIEKKKVSYEFELDVNDEIMTNTINEKCGMYNIPHVNAKLLRVNGAFEITKEKAGKLIDLETNVNEIHDYLLNEWDGKSGFSREIKMVVDEPVATVEDCKRVDALLGTYTTTFSGGSGNYHRNKNMENGVNKLNAITLCQGEVLSVNSYLEPWTSGNGWHPAGTYVNGRVENSLGGGICQVSTTLYVAMLNAEIEIAERYAHSMSVGYVPLSMDAALAGTWKDLKVRNNTDTPIYIEAIYNPAGKITFNIYGKETRPANRKVEYKSEVLSTTPSSEIIKENPDLPTGYRAVTSSGHNGYKARLLKRVYVDGVLQSEEVVNKSSYASSPTYVTVGTGTVVAPETPQPTPQPLPDVPATEPTTTKPQEQDTTNVDTEKPSEEQTTQPPAEPEEPQTPSTDVGENPTGDGSNNENNNDVNNNGGN